MQRKTRIHMRVPPWASSLARRVLIPSYALISWRIGGEPDCVYWGSPTTARAATLAAQVLSRV